MCGIYGHLQRGSKKNSAEVCLTGLKLLEYRGYDSAGIATIDQESILFIKKVGKVALLEKAVLEQNAIYSMAIAHTRWATHGAQTDLNAHPHFDHNADLALVHNGIVENYRELKEELLLQGCIFRSDTDSEVISQLIGLYYKGDLLLAVRQALVRLKGSFAIALIHKNHPKEIIAASHFCPLVIGLSPDGSESYLSSDTGGLASLELDVIYLHEGEIASITPGKAQISTIQGVTLVKTRERLNVEEISYSKEGYDYFMLKEIFEQPRTVQNLLGTRTSESSCNALFPELDPYRDQLKKTQAILILACGSSYHAGRIAAHLLERHAKIETRVETASEFRYSKPLIRPNTLVIAISQSGETADTLAAMREAKSAGCFIIGICNVARSAITRQADTVLFLEAGPELSVCSTKAFTSQVTLLSLLSLYLARLGTLSKEESMHFLHHLQKLPEAIIEVLSSAPAIEALAKKYASFHNFFFIGRQEMYPTALEGALKLKEISYLNASAYPAGEMKHGPIALISPDLPTIALACNEVTIDKLYSNLMEIKARNGPLLILAPRTHLHTLSISQDVIWMPPLHDDFAPIPVSVALQLFAYHIALLCGTDIDRPRNLAKSVTVE